MSKRAAAELVYWSLRHNSSPGTLYRTQWRSRLLDESALIDPHLEPLCFEINEVGRIMVDAHQVVCDRAENVIADEIVQHVHLTEDDLIMRLRKD